MEKDDLKNISNNTVNNNLSEKNIEIQNKKVDNLNNKTMKKPNNSKLKNNYNDFKNNVKSNNNQENLNNNIKPDKKQKSLNDGITPYKNQNDLKNNTKVGSNQKNNNSPKNNISKNNNNSKNSNTTKNISNPKKSNNQRNSNTIKNNGNQINSANPKNNNSPKVNNKTNNPKNNTNQKNNNKSKQNNNLKNNVNSNISKNKINNSKTDLNQQKKVSNNNLNKQSNNENIKKQSNSVEVNEEKKKTKNVFIYIILTIILIIAFIAGMFVYNIFNNKIIGNVYIEDINVSTLGYSEAKEKIENAYNSLLKEDIKFVYEEKEYQIKLEDIGFSILSEEAVGEAKNIGKDKNILLAMKEYYSSLLGTEYKIDLKFDYNEEKLLSKIKELENNFYREVKQSSYVVEDNKLKITNGISGIKVDYDSFKNNILELVRKRDLSEIIEIPIKIEEPEPINVEKIHDEVFVETANAYYDKNPFKIHDEVIGIDFDKDELSQMLELEPEKQEYIIDLQITEPQIKVDDLGLYNDILGQCRTAYVNNPNRTTNLRLAAGKINGKILMPGESFSYNEIVGERTVAAGYRNAAIYVNGEVEDGLAGGICQISSTLYDAVVYSNLQVDERFNHARVPSYVTAGRDATVYWGSKDFKFTNNREYPIKIELTVNGGYANAIIYGMKTDNEYEISFASSVVSRYNGYMVVKTYKVYKQNGVEIKRELISTDSYKV
ncbi:MAG: VanW family protein [Clostridia bacterium]|nr:VanW family protein [Clostridia bacterium]